MKASSRCSTCSRSAMAINALMIGTVSWLGLKVGRRVSPSARGLARPRKSERRAASRRVVPDTAPRVLREHIMKRFRAKDEELEDIDMLELVLPHARRSRDEGVRRLDGADVQLPRPRLEHSTVDVPNLPQFMQVDVARTVTSEPCLNNPDYRNWLHARRRGSLPQLRHRRDHVVQRAPQPARRGARRPAAALFLPPLLGARGRRGHRRRPRPRGRALRSGA